VSTRTWWHELPGHADTRLETRDRFFPDSDVPLESGLGYNPVFWSSLAAQRRRDGRSMSPAAAVVVMDTGPVPEAPWMSRSARTLIVPGLSTTPGAASLKVEYREP